MVIWPESRFSFATRCVLFRFFFFCKVKVRFYFQQIYICRWVNDNYVHDGEAADILLRNEDDVNETDDNEEDDENDHGDVYDDNEEEDNDKDEDDCYNNDYDDEEHNKDDDDMI